MGNTVYFLVDITAGVTKIEYIVNTTFYYYELHKKQIEITKVFYGLELEIVLTFVYNIKNQLCRLEIPYHIVRIM